MCEVRVRDMWATHIRVFCAFSQLGGHDCIFGPDHTDRGANTPNRSLRAAPLARVRFVSDGLYD